MKLPHRPIIGVLAQDNFSFLGARLDTNGNVIHPKFKRPSARLFDNIEHGKGFADSTYVKWFKTGGADVYIIPVKTTNEELTIMMNTFLSGIQFPGAGALELQSWHVAHTCVVFCVFLCCALQIFEVQTQKQCLFGLFVDSSEFQ